jgi:hypothetical protein
VQGFLYVAVALLLERERILESEDIIYLSVKIDVEKGLKKKKT